MAGRSFRLYSSSKSWLLLRILTAELVMSGYLCFNKSCDQITRCLSQGGLLPSTRGDRSTPGSGGFCSAALACFFNANFRTRLADGPPRLCIVVLLRSIHSIHPSRYGTYLIYRLLSSGEWFRPWVVSISCQLSRVNIYWNDLLAQWSRLSDI